MVRFGNAKYLRFRAWNIPVICNMLVSTSTKTPSSALLGTFVAFLPLCIYTHQTKEPDQGMSHKSNTAALGRAAKEGNLDVALLQGFNVVSCSHPSSLADRISIILCRGQDSMSTSINFDLISKANLDTRLHGWTKEASKEFQHEGQVRTCCRHTRDISGPLNRLLRRRLTYSKTSRILDGSFQTITERCQALPKAWASGPMTVVSVQL